jgi:biotin carboxylase
VVKPLVLSASCGVIRADTPAEFTAAFHRVFALLRKLGLAAAADDSGRLLLVEDFVSGREVALEGLLTDGKLRVLALFDKPDPLDGPFFEETIYITPSRLPLAIQADIAQCAAHAAEALGLREGPVHGEMRVNTTGVWMIELAARSIGGRCSRTLRFAAGLSLEEVILRHALRMALPELNGTPRPAGVMMLPIWKSGVLQEVRGQMDALAVPGVEELVITAQAGEELIPLPEGTRYLGFLIARGEHPEAVEATLREAYRRLEVVIIRTPSAQVLSF